MRLQDVRAYLVARPRLSWLVGLLVALLLTAPAWTPWLDPRQYLWGVDDAKNHMIRIYHLTWLIERGVWYPRWLPDMYMGYGYPVLNFYAPIFYYLAWGLGQLLRLSVWDSFRAVGVVAALVSAGGVYALTVALWRRLALGVLAAVVLQAGRPPGGPGPGLRPLAAAGPPASVAGADLGGAPGLDRGQHPARLGRGAQP